MISLRDFQQQDTEQLISILNDTSVTQFLSSKIPSPYTASDANWWITEGSRSELIKAITLDDQLIGCVSVLQGEFEFNRSAELGYWLAKEYWHKGSLHRQRLCYSKRYLLKRISSECLRMCVRITPPQ